MKRGIFILYVIFILCFSFSVYSTEQDLVAYWNFDEGSGDIAGDSSGNGNVGFLGGKGAYVKGKPTWTTGIKNGALNFNGVDNYIFVDDGIFAAPNPSLDMKADQSFTISVWVKTSAFGKHMALLERYDAMPYHTLRISNNNKASFTIRGANGGEPSTSGGILLNDGNWHNVAAVRDVASDKLLIYVDGILESNAVDSSVGDLGTLATNLIGMGSLNSGGTNYFEGLMDEYKIYKRALTSNEIKSQYDSMFVSVSNPLVYFDFEEVKNGFIEDLSGNNYNGKISGSPTIVQGKVGNAIQFNPSAGDAVNLLIPTINTQKDSKVTVEFWMYWDGSASNIPFGFETYHIMPSSTNLAFGTGANDLYGANINDLANRWVHIAAEFNNGLTSLNNLYIDGVKKDVIYISGVQGVSYKGQVTPSARISGWATSGALKLKGKIDEFRVYNGVLSEEDVLKHYEGKFGGLLASWSFDEESTTIAYDSSGKGNNGEIKGPIKVEGVKGKALSFDGINDYIDIGPGQLSVKKEMTLEAWINPSSLNSKSYAITKSSGSNGPPYYHYALQFDNNCNDKFEFDFGINSLLKSICSNTVGVVGNWYHIVGVFDGSNKKIYVNGLLENTEAVSGNINSYQTPFLIGKYETSNSNLFMGLIDEVKIYSKALTADEIKKSYDETKPQSQEPIAYWNFDEGSGTTVGDSSGNGNTGTIQGGATWVDGIKGKALQLDGVDDLIYCLDTNCGGLNKLDMNSDTGISFGAWIKPLQAKSGYIISKWSGGGYGYALAYHPGGFVEAFGADEPCTNNGYVIGGGSNKINEWSHAFVTISSGSPATMKLYVNGQLVASNSKTYHCDNSADFRVGNSMKSLLYAGVVDEVKVYNRVLGDSEVLENYQSTLPQKPTCQTSCYWKVGDKVTGGNEQIAVENAILVQAKADCLKNSDGYLLADGTQVNFIVKESDFFSEDDYFGQQTSNVVVGNSAIDVLTNFIDDNDNQDEYYFYIEGVKDCNSGIGGKQLLYVNEPVECGINEDCAAGEICESGSCFPGSSQPSCSDSIPCPQGEECVGGQCVTLAPQCTSGADCAAGEICINSNCQVQETLGGGTGGEITAPTSETAEFVPVSVSKELAFPVPKKYTISSSNLEQGLFNNLESIDIFPAYEIEGKTKYCDTPYTHILK